MNIHSILASVVTATAFAATTTAEEAVSFETSILPILESKCIKCHATEHTDAAGKVKKPKGGLVMDSAAGLTKGGKNAKDKTLVAGKPDESELYRVTTLPSSDDDAMPPEGKADPLTDAEKELLKKWITEGAKFGEWKGK
jgi:uncharacterized membrane protein